MNTLVCGAGGFIGSQLVLSGESKASGAKDRRIRFLCAVEPPTPILRDLLPHLTDSGVEVELLITRREYRGGLEPLGDLLGRAGVAVRSIWVPGGRKAAGPREANVSLAFGFGAMLRSLFGRRTDLNVFLTQPPLFYLLGYLLKLLRGHKYAVVVMDLYPDVAIRFGILRQGLLARLLVRVSRIGLRRADHVIVIGRCMRDLLEAEGVSAEALQGIPNWADERTVFPVPPAENSLRRELGIADHDFVVAYSGNMGRLHDFDDILEAARRLRDRRGIRFVFIGDGARRRGVEAFRERHGLLESITLLPFQPTSRMSESLSLGDVHFVSLRDGFEGLVVPSKTYGALAAGRPVIYQGDWRGEVARLLVESGAGIVTPTGDAEALERAILQFHEHPDDAQRAGDAALRLTRGPLGRMLGLKSYVDVLCA